MASTLHRRVPGGKKGSGITFKAVRETVKIIARRRQASKLKADTEDASTQVDAIDHMIMVLESSGELNDTVEGDEDAEDSDSVRSKAILCQSNHHDHCYLHRTKAYRIL